MDFCKDYRLVEGAKGITLEIYLNEYNEEFASSFSSEKNENAKKLDEQIKRFIMERFSDVKINTVKIIIGTVVLGTLTLYPETNLFTSTPAQATSVQASLNTTARVTTYQLNMRNGPSTGHSIMHVLWQGNVVKIIGETNGWYQIKLSDGRVGWASSKYLVLNNQEATRQEKVSSVINLAKSYAGTPYVSGSENPKNGGFDCSGFTKYVFGRNGYSLNRISRDQAKNGAHVPRASIQPGDLVFHSFDKNGVISHVGIYLGYGQMIHSPKTGDVVKITNVGTTYWRDRYVTARRII